MTVPFPPRQLMDLRSRLLVRKPRFAGQDAVRDVRFVSKPARNLNETSSWLRFGLTFAEPLASTGA